MPAVSCARSPKEGSGFGRDDAIVERKHPARRVMRRVAHRTAPATIGSKRPVQVPAHSRTALTMSSSMELCHSVAVATWSFTSGQTLTAATIKPLSMGSSLRASSMIIGRPVSVAVAQEHSPLALTTGQRPRERRGAAPNLPPAPCSSAIPREQ